MDSIGALLSHSFLYNRPVLGLYPFLHPLFLSAIIYCDSIQVTLLPLPPPPPPPVHTTNFLSIYLPISPLLFNDIDLYQPPILAAISQPIYPTHPLSLCLSLSRNHELHPPPIRLYRPSHSPHGPTHCFRSGNDASFHDSSH